MIKIIGKVKVLVCTKCKLIDAKEAFEKTDGCRRNIGTHFDEECGNKEFWELN